MPDGGEADARRAGCRSAPGGAARARLRPPTSLVLTSETISRSRTPWGGHGGARLTREVREDGKDRLSRRLAEDGVHVDPAVHVDASGRPERGRLLLARQCREPRRPPRSAKP